MAFKFQIFAVLIALFFITSVKAAECGGAVQCQCGDSIISSTILDHDILDCNVYYALTINANNVALDCNGHTIAHGWGQNTAIFLNNTNSSTVKNCNIGEKYDNGIVLGGGWNNRIEGNTVINPLMAGIWAHGSRGNTILANTIWEFRQYAIALFPGSSSNIIQGNTIMGKPATLENPYPSFFGIFMDSGVGYNQIIGNSIERSHVGINVFGGSFITINGNTLQNNEYGTYLSHFNDGKISDNKFIGNTISGLDFEMYTERNVIWNNIFQSNKRSAFEGIVIQSGIFAYNIANKWDNGLVGNYWSDFSANSGYPAKYVISGPGDGVDNLPNKKTSDCIYSSATAVSSTNVKTNAIASPYPKPICKLAISNIIAIE
ncbi:right-handed parallel beta-helix repeat-containing protein [Candidatus Micrarchaeota archaeon]|nr:right-handed parallel beta-helix repeat-containing protein [Candidatus Micrarchaeota archaeon]